MAAGIHTIDIKVRGYHLDVFGHVNNARYLEFLEEARWAAFEEKVDFATWARQGYAFTVVSITINYRRPALLNETLRVETSLRTLGGKSGVVHQDVRLGGSDALVADADVTFVLFDPVRKKAVALAGEVRELLESL